MKRQSFPDVFHKGSGWVEVEWFAPRTHDSNAGFRRVSRVFLKPARPPHDMQQFLNAQRSSHESDAMDLDGVALVTQMLLIDAQGTVKPTTLTTEVQVRRFQKTDAGVLEKTSVQVAEISRRRLMGEPETGGLVVEDESSAAYLGGYGFAEGQPVQPDQSNVTGLPLQVKLTTRCAGCHGENLAVVHTFSIATCTANCPPGYRIPAVRELDASGSEAAEFDIREKKKRAEFEALRKYLH